MRYVRKLSHIGKNSQNRAQGNKITLSKRSVGVHALRGYFGPPMRSKNKSCSSQVSSY